MKLILTIETFKSGEKNGIGWASATGVDAVGRRARAAFRDPREGDGRKLATAIVKQIGSLLSDGQDVSDIKPVVECLGSWRDRQISRGGKPVENNGKPVMERYFETASFSVLSGPALELRRTKLRAAEVADIVKAAMEAGDTAKAAEAALEFLNAFSGRPADEDIDDDADEPAAPEAVDASRATAAPAPSVEDAPEAGVASAETAPVVEAEIVPEAASAPAAEAPVVETQAADEAPAVGGEDIESLVAAVEAAPPVHPEPAAAPVAAQAPPVRPNLGRPPVVAAAGVRSGVMPRPVAAAAPPVRSPAAAPAAAPAVARPAPVRPQVQGGVAPRPVVAGAPRPAAARPAPSGYREPAAGEDPEALAGAVMSKVARPGMPPAVRTPPSRPGVR